MKFDFDSAVALVAVSLVVAAVFAPLAVMFWKDALAYQPKEIACPK